MPFEFVIYEKRDHIAVVTINRPNVNNALHPAANLELSDVWDDFRDDPNLWVAVVTGAGNKAFCAGADLKQKAANPEPQARRLLKDHGFGGLTHFVCYKPIIAAVNGFALGGGLELAMACDIIIAANTATFGLPEPKWGLMAGAGGTLRLPRLVPQKIAMGMLLTGKSITANEAYRLGLVNEVVRAADVMATAERWAREISECAPLSVQASKQSALEGLDSPLFVALNRNSSLFEMLTNSEDAIEGPRAFAEKRKPVWKGR